MRLSGNAAMRKALQPEPLCLSVCAATKANERKAFSTIGSTVCEPNFPSLTVNHTLVGQRVMMHLMNRIRMSRNAVGNTARRFELYT